MLQYLFFLFLPVLTSGCEKSEPLGMINGDIQDWQITASSTYPIAWDKGCNEHNARLYVKNGYGWCAKYKSTSEWLQVDLGVVSKVTGIMIQGRGDGKEWVTSFMMSYSIDGYHWDYVADVYGNQRIFDGNSNSYAVKHSYLDAPITTRFVKVHTVSWHGHPSMRVELLGCQTCKQPVGLPPYGKITVSSHKSFKQGSSCMPDDGHILSNKAWCAKRDDDTQWLQFDVGPPTKITGIVTKGRGDTKRDEWITRFRVSYSNDTKVWFFYKDESHLAPKTESWPSWKQNANSTSKFLPAAYRYTRSGLIFGGNTDKHTPRYHFLNAPFFARYIRIHPIEWNKRVSLRAGLLGCGYQGQCGAGFVRITPDTPCVENMAYKKKSYINNKRSGKRHTGNHWAPSGQASRAVDGNVDKLLSSCTILDNSFSDHPIWMVDLGTKSKVSGIVIHTWQGDEEKQRFSLRSFDARSQTNYRDYMNNLDRLTVYVDQKAGRDNIQMEKNKCGFVSRLNNALFKPRIHVECVVPLRGRYILVEAAGVSNRWTRLFSAVLCEVEVY